MDMISSSALQIGWVLAGAGGSGLAGPVFISFVLRSIPYPVQYS